MKGDLMARVVRAVEAGLTTSEGIARVTGEAVARVSMALNHLEKKGAVARAGQTRTQRNQPMLIWRLT